MLIDSHCHLEYEGLVEDQQGVLARAREAGIAGFLNISTRQREWDRVVGTAAREADVWASIGIHPHEADQHADLGEAALLEAAAHPKVIAIGETGLDYHRTAPEGRDAQLRSFRDHIALAKELNLVLQIHDRDAHADVLDVLERDGAPERTVFHCFSGDAAMAQLCAYRGYYVSFAGNITFKNAGSLRAALAVTPLENVLVETDAPFLTPHPQRGRVNSPSQVATTMRTIGEVLGCELEKACRTIDATSERLYGPW